MIDILLGIYLVVGFISGVFSIVFTVSIYKPKLGSADGYALIDKTILLIMSMLFWIFIIVGYGIAKGVGKYFIHIGACDECRE